MVIYTCSLCYVPYNIKYYDYFRSLLKINMYLEELIELVLKFSNGGKAYAYIEKILCLIKKVARQLCRYVLNKKHEAQTKI